MSVQFGRCSFEGMPPHPELFEKVDAILAPYGPDGGNFYQEEGLGVLYRAFHTTKESRSENQPHVSRSGSVITWDGRLDNRAEFIALMSDRLETNSSDVSVVASAYERWGTRCFARLLGDWALSIWDPHDRSLTLAKDFLGSRHLYYSAENDRVSWSTVLEPLLLFAARTFALDEEYIAGYLSFFPAAHLTPYAGIQSVPPSCFVRLERGRHTVSKYWDFDLGSRVRYRADSEYEEHFRNAFAQAVQRRLRSDAPILAELSGGMDSSSIVCVADTVIARGIAGTPRLDTLSYYNDSEPNWNERPYFARVEQKRGRTGCHIDVSAHEPLLAHIERDAFAATPGAAGGRRTAANGQFAACILSQGNRVVLSGTGGDEATGGVPTPTPELMDLLARAKFGTLARQIKAWALNKRKPWFHLLFEAAREFLPPAIVGVPQHMRPADWLRPSFARRYRVALTGYPSRVRLLGALPTFQRNLSALDMLRRQLACTALSSHPPHEKRYPYLDRELLEFLYAIPREQLVRPGQRRSLMRRALVGTVPDELLNRKRKAFVIRSPMAAISRECTSLIEMSQQMLTSSLEIVDANVFREAVRKARQGQEIRAVPMKRTQHDESWLRTIRDRPNLNGGSSTVTDGSALLGEQCGPAEPFP